MNWETSNLATEKFELALQDYEYAARLEPADATDCAYVGKALSKLNRHAEAIQRYRQALQLQSDLWEAHFTLGDELVADNKSPTPSWSMRRSSGLNRTML
jgi:tetratricopeptide (TPR) repeat protein